MTHIQLSVVRLLGLLVVALAVAAPVRAQLLPSYGEDRAGTSGFQFLEVPVDPRGAALGGTAVTTANDASALFWNPALASNGVSTQVSVANLQYVADVSMNFVGVTRRVGAFTVGAHVQTLDSGEMLVTDEFSGPAGTGQTFKYLGVVGGLTVSQSLTNLFSYGVTAKLAREASADLAAQSALLDLGVHYKVGTTGANIGVAIRNFGLNGGLSGTLERLTLDEGVVTETDFEDIVPPTTFMMGVSYDVLKSNEMHDLVVAGQLTNPNDNAERMNVGAEYTFNDLLIVRGGYSFGAEEATLPSLGFGVNIPGIGAGGLRADYGFTKLERLGVSHRIGVSVRL